MGPSLLALHLHSPTALSSLPPDVAHIPVYPAAFCSCARLNPCSRLSAHAGLFCLCKIPGALGKLQHCFCTAEVSLACGPVARSPLNPSSRRHVHGRLAILVRNNIFAHKPKRLPRVHKPPIRIKNPHQPPPSTNSQLTRNPILSTPFPPLTLY